MKNKIFRQGDVLIKKIARKKVEGKQEVSSKKNRIVLAYGETTGHAHAFYDEGVTLTETENQRFLDIVKTVELKHEEHDTVILEPGFYEVLQQQEYHPEEIRNVLD